ncbi:MAG: cytochrome c [Sphingomonas fennica]
MRAFLLLALLAAPASAQSAGQWRGPAHIWAASCGYCHDVGGPGPALKGRRLNPALIAAVVRNGVPGMPNFHAAEIDDRELATLAKYVSAAPASTAKAK